LIKRQTGWCAPAGPLLNVSHLSPGFTTTEPAVLHAPTYVRKYGFAGWEKQRKTYRRSYSWERSATPPLHSWPFFRVFGPTYSLSWRSVSKKIFAYQLSRRLSEIMHLRLN